MIDRFTWRSYDLRSLLLSDWQSEVLEAAKHAAEKTLIPQSITSREGDKKLRIPIRTLSGVAVRQRLPWLYDLYKGLFRDLGQLGVTEPLYTAESDLHGAVLNVQGGAGMRYECHVDSNPVEGLLYVTDHPKGSGGELVVANNMVAKSVEEVDADCSVVYPVEGNLIFFDARRFAHYVRPLAEADATRIVVAMNFYTPSCPEASRPADLDQHLFGY